MTNVVPLSDIVKKKKEIESIREHSESLYKMIVLLASIEIDCIDIEVVERINSLSLLGDVDKELLDKIQEDLMNNVYDAYNRFGVMQPQDATDMETIIHLSKFFKILSGDYEGLKEHEKKPRRWIIKENFDDFNIPMPSGLNDDELDDYLSEEVDKMEKVAQTKATIEIHDKVEKLGIKGTWEYYGFPQNLNKGFDDKDFLIHCLKDQILEAMNAKVS